MPSGTVWDLFNEFIDQGEARVKQALQPNEFEDHYLDYKENLTDKGVATDVVNLAVYSKAASAFANTDPGVIVWGILDKQGKPRQLSPIPNITAFTNRLTELANRTLDPPLSGIIS